MTNFIICFSSQIFDYDRDPVTEDKMGGARATHGKERQCTKGFGWSTGKNKTAQNAQAYVGGSYLNES